MKKLLSVVVPTYNMEKLLPRCLDSLVKPHCNEALEVLVVNDGSSDNSLAIAKEYENKYPGIIKVIDKENGNYGSAINKGIDVATGKYFRIVDADDFYINEGLNTLIENLSKLDTDVILTNYRRDRGVEKVYYYAPKNSYNKEIEFTSVNIKEYKNFVMHGITIKTSILKDNHIRLQHGISYTDIEYCFYPIPFINTFIALDVIVYCYQLGREGQTVNLSSQLKSLGHMEKIANRMYDYLKNQTFNTSIQNKLIHHFCDICSLCLMTILCYDISNKNIEIASRLVNKIRSIAGAEKIMLSKSMYGVKYYQRFALKQKLSNNRYLSMYYKVIKKILPSLTFLRSL